MNLVMTRTTFLFTTLAALLAASCPSFAAAPGLTLERDGGWLVIHDARIPTGELRVNYLEAYCRGGSTAADWVNHTVIPYTSKLVSLSPDKKVLRLRDTLADGLIVEHTITAGEDEVDFRLVAHNPTARRSEAVWAQPCVRVGAFAGFNPDFSQGDLNDYLPKCFIFLDGRLTRLPTRHWATRARYMPGQVWGAPGVSRADLNPRPLSKLAPSNGLIGCFSKDDKMIFATAWQPYQELFQGIARCLHSDFRLGGIGPGQSLRIRGKIYLVPNNVPALLRRYAKDFPEQVSAGVPFDYFQNSWQVIGLKDYDYATRITPQNELVLADNTKLRLSAGTPPKPLSRQQTKTLLDGWLPIVLLHTEQAGVRYHFTLWATPLPTVKDWKAAFNWPTEGENYLNWIQVKAINAGSRPAEARVRLARVSANGAASLTDWRPTLAPHQTAVTCFRAPFMPVADSQAFAGASPQVWLKRTVRFWRGLLAQGARFEVPDKESMDTLRAAHVCQFIVSDNGELHGGEGFYDTFYVRDGAYQLLELEEAGLWDTVRKALPFFLRAQHPDGHFGSPERELDGNGQALWALWQYWKMSGDLSWLRKVYPQMRRAVEWLKRARRQAQDNSPFAGLLPGVSFADGEHLVGGKHHIVGYDFWNLRGLLCAADAARALGDTADAGDFQREAADYRHAIDAAWKRTGLPYFPPSWERVGTPWGNTEILWPTELFDPHDPRVTALLTEVREHHGGGFVEHTIRWTGAKGAIHPYLSSYTTMDSLIRGEHDTFVQEYYWYLLHSTATHAFPEGVYYKRRYAWNETIPHPTGAANFAIMFRHALIHECRNELHLLLGVPDQWLAPGKEIRIENAPTDFGPLTLRIRGKARGLDVQFIPPRRQPPQRIVLHLPRSRPALTVPKGVTVQLRPDQARRWDFATVVRRYLKTAPPLFK